MKASVENIACRPRRKPDFILSDNCYDRYLSFWWHEKVQHTTQGDAYYYIDVNNMTWLDIRGMWRRYTDFLNDQQEDEIRKAYLTWLIEKELLAVGNHGNS